MKKISEKWLIALGVPVAIIFCALIVFSQCTQTNAQQTSDTVQISGDRCAVLYVLNMQTEVRQVRCRDLRGSEKCVAWAGDQRIIFTPPYLLKYQTCGSD